MAADAVEWARYPIHADSLDYIRSVVAAGGGPGGRGAFYDTGRLRSTARIVWATAREQSPDVLGPDFNPAWAETPDGVRDIAAYCWRNAIHLMSQHAGAISRVARALNRHKTLTGDQVAEAITRRPARRTVDPEVVGTDFWLTAYSRIVWRPHGMCRSASTRMNNNKEASSV
jgi:hypothetical protein